MQRDYWRVGLLAREASRNVFGIGSRMFTILLLAVLAGAGSSAYIALETQAMRHEIDDLATQGRNVLVFAALSNDAPASIERRSCESLSGQRGVQHAGLLVSGEQLDVMPIGTRLPVQRASTSLFPELGTADLLVGHQLSNRGAHPFSVRHGDVLATAVDAGTHPEDLGAGSTITLPLRPDETSSEQCVVILDAYSNVDEALPAVAAQLKVAVNPISGSELLTATNDPITAYLQRPGRWFPMLVGFVGAIATVITTRLRASEIAVYRMSGTSTRSVMTLLSLEALLISGTAALAATAASLVLLPYYLDPAVPILWGLALAGVWALAALAASIDLAFRRPHDLAKDR